MKVNGICGPSVAQRAELWRRWREGFSAAEIPKALGFGGGTIHGILLNNGGYSPALRARNPAALSLPEREDISRSLATGDSLRSIARRLCRAASTISREIRRHGGRRAYRATLADKAAWRSALRPKRCLLSVNAKLCAVVASKLEQKWSPEQISGWLKSNFAADENMRVSHETIYRSLFVQARGVLKKELIKQLRTRRVMRRSRTKVNPERRGTFHDGISIRERPAQLEDRAVPGHWEGDLICGSKQSYIVTLVERQSRFTALLKIPNREAGSVVAALTRHVRGLPAALCRSLTWDRGKEMSKHAGFTVATDVKIYFCDPQSPWQRGSNENTNGLLRQYFPKGTDLSRHSQAELNKVAKQLNQRPRETLAFQTPADRFKASVAVIS